jgi:hypothetical protein
MIEFHDRVEFDFDVLNKTDKPSKPIHRLVFHKYLPDIRLDFMECLDQYGKVTHKDRLADKEKHQLFISYRKPFHAISTQTIARWLKVTMAMSGIDTSTFTAHSTRSASTSKALNKGLSIKQITDKANWSNQTTFLKFYKRNVIFRRDEFQEAVLSLTV